MSYLLCALNVSQLIALLSLLICCLILSEKTMLPIDFLQILNYYAYTIIADYCYYILRYFF